MCAEALPSAEIQLLEHLEHTQRSFRQVTGQAHTIEQE
jgi:hypothetical protein